MKTDDNKPAPSPKKPSDKDGKVFDVSRPGKAPASPTSRPVIVGHKPEAQAAQAAVSGVGEARPMLAKRKIEITPTGATETEAAPPVADAQPALPEQPTMSETAPEAASTVSAQEKDAIATAALDAAVTGPPALPPDDATSAEPPADKPPLTIEPPEPESSEEAEATTQSQESETGPADPAPAPAEAAPKIEEPAASTPDLPLSTTSSVPETDTRSELNAPAEAEDAPPEPKIEPLFDASGHIVVSHHSPTRHHSLKVVTLLVLILLLAVVAADLLLDLDVLKFDGVPRTDFFPSAKP